MGSDFFASFVQQVISRLLYGLTGIYAALV